MKLVNGSYKDSITVLAESTEDLWTLSTILGKGDSIVARTFRKIKPTEDAKAIKKPITLSLSVLKAEWFESSPALRISGTVTEGTDDVPKGAHHTITIDVNDKLTIKKDWISYQKERLDDALKSKPLKIILVVFDREKAVFARMLKKGFTVLGEIKGKVEKKQMSQSGLSDFFEDIVKKLREYVSQYAPESVIAASPDFWKSALEKKLTPELKKITTFATCSNADESSLNEVLRRPEIQHVLHSSRIAYEAKAVDELLSAISKNEPSAYGLKEVSHAVSAGAVRELIVTDSLLRSKIDVLEPLLKLAESMKSKLLIISSEHDAGKQVDGLGGIAALLRFNI